MSGGHALVSGRQLASSNKILKVLDDLRLGTNFQQGEYLYPTVDDLVNAMITGVSSEFDMLTSILILDFGFENEGDVGSCIEEFIEVQDILNQYNLRKVKLYLLTKNADLYDRINQDYSGREVLIYPNTEVFITKEFQISMINSVMSGSRDGLGLRPKRKETLTRIQRIEQERKSLEEDAQQVEKETLEYEKDIPQSKLNREEYLGTAQSSAKLAQLEKERTNTIRKAERLGLSYYVDDWGEVTLYDADGEQVNDIDEYEQAFRNQRRESKQEPTQSQSAYERELSKQTEHLPPRQEPTYPESNHEEEESSGLFNNETEDETQQYKQPPIPPRHTSPQKPTGSHIGQSYPVGNTSSVRGREDTDTYKPFKENSRVTGRDVGSEERVESLSTVKLLFDDLLSDGMGLVEDKLHDDSVVMAVSSVRGSGGSGLTAQIAEVYAMLGRKVVVLDLDLNGRGQSYYFNNYDEQVARNKGIANALINVIDGGVINRASVTINSRIDVCGISQSVGTINEKYKETIARNLNSVLIDAKEFYDIVLLDIPIEDFNIYTDKSFSQVERFLFVTENKEYEIERLFRQYLAEFVESNGMLISDIFNNATIVLNKYSNTNRDQQGYHINKQWLKEKLYDKGAPYDSILVSGEIPFARNFEEQFLTNQRYVWQDSGYMATIKNMLKEAV